MNGLPSIQFYIKYQELFSLIFFFFFFSRMSSATSFAWHTLRVKGSCHLKYLMRFQQCQLQYVLWRSKKNNCKFDNCRCVIHDIFSSPELFSGWAIVITFHPSSVHSSVNIFKRLLLWSRLASFAQISYGASLGWGEEKLLKWSRSIDQDGHYAHIWGKPLKIFSRTKNALGLNLCRNYRGREVFQNC